MGYSEKDIRVIKEDVERIKKRPDMYIGNKGWTAFLHLIKEILQNSVDDAGDESSPCDLIIVDLDEQTKTASIIDNGRGIPLGSIIDVCTFIQSSGKFEKGKGKAFSIAAGKNGVGLTAANALSVKCTVIVCREGIKKTVVFEFGHPVDIKEEKCSKSKTGTIVTFTPNEEVLGKIKCDHKALLDLCETMAYLSKIKIKCHVYTKSGKDINEKYESKNGIVDLLNKLCPKQLINPIYIGYADEDYRVEAVFTYAPESDIAIESGGSESIISYANYCTTIEGGTHVIGFKQAISNVLPKFVRENCLNKNEVKKLNIIPDDAKEGLVAIVNVGLLEADFSGQVKEKLINDDVVGIVRSTIVSGLNKWIKDNDKDAKKIGDWIKTMAKARMKATEEKKAVIKDSGIGNAFSKDRPKNWVPATGKKDLELFIVEGESAGGSAKTSRDKLYQELFYLKGVILNITGLSVARILENDEIRGLLQCIGTNIGRKFDIKKCRYKRIIIMTDGDSDGDKITSLLCLFFMYYLRPLVEAGMVYKVVPPLYKINAKNKDVYIKDNKEYASFVQNSIATSMEIHRFLSSGIDSIKLSSKSAKVQLKKKDIVDLIVRTKKYLRDLDKTSRNFICNPELLEIIASYYDVFEDGKEKDIKAVIKSIKTRYPYLRIQKENGVWVIDEYADKEYQFIRLDEKKMKKIKPLAQFLKTEPSLHYSVNDEVVSLYRLLKIFESYEPSHRQRYKGLGEMNPGQLWETTLNPENRTLIRLNIGDFERDLGIFNLLHSKKEDCRRERKQLMSKFKVDIDDIDN